MKKYQCINAAYYSKRDGFKTRISTRRLSISFGPTNSQPTSPSLSNGSTTIPTAINSPPRQASTNYSKPIKSPLSNPRLTTWIGKAGSSLRSIISTRSPVVFGPCRKTMNQCLISNKESFWLRWGALLKDVGVMIKKDFPVSCFTLSKNVGNWWARKSSESKIVSWG